MKNNWTEIFSDPNWRAEFLSWYRNSSRFTRSCQNKRHHHSWTERQRLLLSGPERRWCLGLVGWQDGWGRLGGSGWDLSGRSARHGRLDCSAQWRQAKGSVEPPPHPVGNHFARRTGRCMAFPVQFGRHADASALTLWGRGNYRDDICPSEAEVGGAPACEGRLWVVVHFRNLQSCTVNCRLEGKIEKNDCDMGHAHVFLCEKWSTLLVATDWKLITLVRSATLEDALKSWDSKLRNTSCWLRQFPSYKSTCFRTAWKFYFWEKLHVIQVQ